MTSTLTNTRKREPVFYWSGRSQYENLGDALINQVLTEAARELGSLMVDDRGVPNEFLECVGIRESERLSLKGGGLLASIAVNRWRRIPCVVLQKPGHVYRSSGGPRNLAHELFKISALLLLRTLGVRTARLGVSVGPLPKPYATLERYRSSLSSVYGVRESISDAYCRQHKFQNLVHCSDLALCIPSSAASSNNRPWLFGLSFRASPREGVKAAVYEDQIAHLVRSLPRAPLLLVSQVVNDSRFQETLSHSATRSTPLPHVRYDGTLASRKRVESAYASCRYVLSNRLHSLLLASSMGAIPLAVVSSDNAKIIGLMRDIGLERNIFRLPVVFADIHSRLNDLSPIDPAWQAKATAELRHLLARTAGV